jgi:hypothetical protein
MPAYSISRHAVRQYRTRVLACSERVRTDAQLRVAMQSQIDSLPWQLAAGETFVVHSGLMRPKRKKPWIWFVATPLWSFLIECRVVVTTLGFMMEVNRRKSRRHVTDRRRRMRQVPWARTMVAPPSRET